MKKSLIIFLLILAIIIALIVVYTIQKGNALKGNNNVLDKNNQDITYQSLEGTLENGRHYKYFGTAKNNFDLKEYINRLELNHITDYNKKEIATTPQMAAEIAQRYFGLEATLIESVDINVYYDTITDNWVLIKRNAPKVVSTGGKSIITIQRSDGLMKMYSDGLR
ncbi:MAG: hypothetical protein BWY15_01569 [Firmicutes bacterium ADurb.Bin193]|nr:MAG: hypothetical protein BWY15_01569 [Firmicutes bacterium ADurb.Bin193]